MYEQSLISIVDDDQSFRESLGRLLKSHGYTVGLFPSGVAFLESPELVATACLVLDVHMPAKTGDELYMDLVRRGHTIPTILVTAYLDEGLQHRMLAAGVSCYLPKPLESARLLGCLRSAIASGATIR